MIEETLEIVIKSDLLLESDLIVVDKEAIDRSCGALNM